MRQTLFILSIIFSLGLLFNSCKKYPENNLWIKNPNKVIRNDWFMEKYTINGEDSTTNDNVRLYKEKSMTFYVSDNSQRINPYEQFGGYWEMSKNKKYIKLSFYRNTPILSGYQFPNQKNLFLVEEGLDWRIDKLCKNQFWISLTHNNIKYEIRFKS